MIKEEIDGWMASALAYTNQLPMILRSACFCALTKNQEEASSHLLFLRLRHLRRKIAPKNLKKDRNERRFDFADVLPAV